MRPRSQIPIVTKIYLAILGYLGILLIILVILRSADTVLNWENIQALLPGGGTDEAVGQTITPQPAQTIAPTYPPDVPWLRALTDAAIYDTPDGASQPVAILVSGQTAQVVGASADRQWWAIQMPYFVNGQGWVAAGQVTVQNADRAPVVGAKGTGNGTPVPTERMPVAQASTNVNVRSGPDLSFAKIGLLSNGEETEIVGVSPDGSWWAIRLPGDPERTGWVAKDYIIARNEDDVPILRPESAAQGGEASSPQPGKAFLTAAWTVNIRAGPGKQYAVVGTLQQGQTAEIVGVSEDGIWWAIKFENADAERGWVAAAYVETENTQNVPVLK